MRHQVETLGRLPTARKLLVIVAVFVTIVVCVFLLGSLRSDILTGVRAYVGGEGLWSKAEKRAVLGLTQYAVSHDERDYQQYLAEIAVPQGDHLARLQLSSSSPDINLVYKGFVQGRNSPEDVPSLIRLFRRFGRIGYMARAIAIWTEGDRYIDQLQSLAVQLHQEINSPHPDAQKIQQFIGEVTVIDARLTPLEDAFSSTLGEGARWINRVLSIVVVVATLLLLMIGVGLSYVVLKQTRDSEEKYRNIINTANDAILVIDAEKRIILEANRKACEMLGIAESHIVGMAESQIYPPGKSDEYRQLVSLYESSATHGGELELFRSDGTLIPVEVSSNATELNGRAAVLGIFRDIRERREAAATLRRSEERFGHLIANLSDVITVVAVDNTMLYHSPSLERVMGYQPSSLLGKSFLDFVHPQDQTAVRDAFERIVLNAGAAAPPEYRFRHRDGSWIWLESVASNQLNDVAVAGIVVTSRDVSERRVLEEQVRQSQKMDAIGRLAGGIAHDFNNLLMVIRGYAEIVKEETLAIPGVQNSVDTIVRTAESAANLTRQLLSFSRKHVFSPQVLDLNILVARMSEMLTGLIQEQMELDVKLHPGAVCISADPGQIEQVIMNLVVNARDAMPHGGKLSLQTALVEANTAKASALPPGDFVILSVTDTGIGMSSEIQSKIFEPFFTTKSKEEGTGLGLSVVYNIVHGCGGHVRVSSEPGRGSTLQIFFPRSAEHPRTVGVPAPSAPAARAGNETILVAEDQAELRWMICQYLQQLGYSVLEAKDGDDAVALAQQYTGPIDVLLTDVVMPGLRGPQVAQRVSAAHPDMKIIFMSGYTEGAIAPGELPAPDTALLQKPFELSMMAAKIREVLRARTRR